MRTNLKRMLSLVLAMVLCMGAFAGCNTVKPQETQSSDKPKETQGQTQPVETTEKELEPVTLKWYLDAANCPEKEGTADVLEAFNKKLADVLPNTTVEFVFIADWKTNWPLLLAGGEKMDIVWQGWSTNFLADVQDGNIMDITSLVNEYAPNIAAEQALWASAYATATLDGSLYGIPNVQPVVQQAQSVDVAEILYPYFDFEAMRAELNANTHMTAKMLDIIEEAIQKAIDAGTITVGDPSWYLDLSYVLGFGCLGYLPLGTTGNGFKFDPEDENPKPLYIYEIPEMQMTIQRLAQWYDKGWITETQLLGQLPEGARTTVIPRGETWNLNWSLADENGYQKVPATTNKPGAQEVTRIFANTPEEMYVGTSIFGLENSYKIIPYTAENPERAMMLLNLLHDEVGTPGNELLNLLCYGFEKDSAEAKEYGWFNYALSTDADGQPLMDISARGDAQSKHNFENWIVGNTYKVLHDGGSLTTVASKEYGMSYYENVYPTLKRSALADMVVDYAPVQLEVTAIKAVLKEYKTQFSGGSGGVAKVEDLYNACMAKLEEAGLSKVKAELQAQIDAFMAK